MFSYFFNIHNAVNNSFYINIWSLVNYKILNQKKIKAILFLLNIEDSFKEEYIKSFYKDFFHFNKYKLNFYFFLLMSSC